jgi:predicted metal-dependent hydrolase
LIVHHDGSLEIRCPLIYSRSRIDRFISDKASWIQRKRLENEQVISIGVLPAAERESASATLRDLLQKLLSRLALREPVRISVRDQRSRWGSCSSRGHVTINARCVKLPDLLQEYVVLHELCHLQHLDHGAAFWRMLESYLPDARQRRQALNRYRLTQESKHEAN